MIEHTTSGPLPRGGATPRTHYQANICGGDFEHVKQCFRRWKHEPLVSRAGHRMFEDKEEVRRVPADPADNSERAQAMLREMCDPNAPYALAIEVHTGERDMWLVMAAYEA
ncbi:hypothetical protein CY652_03205 [Burkholderia sp. WAC0059]|uniref:hypothetical protein n=1 Tax=Burkholderia sp. WAC0059 TaxID=2066022 RepID=UPI000C7F78AA|nr:hypothetical protein [Burkholderia sp. WAC0059]PLZ03990.1 hypothetical protein CY652_03205 [Burkholderia sp. WAC0059]